MILPFLKEKTDLEPFSNKAIPTIINVVLKEYLETSIAKLGRHVVDEVIESTTKVKELSLLSLEQLSTLLLNLYHKNKEIKGTEVARKDLEAVIKKVVDRLGVTKGYVELLELLPEGVLEDEKLSVLGRNELQNILRERSRELEQSREEFEKRITERTQELETERNKFRIVLYNTVDGVFALDKQKRIIAFNKSMEDMTGFLEAEVLGSPVDNYVKLSDKDANEITSVIYCPAIKLIEEKSVYKAENLLLKGRNNKEFHVNLISSVVAEGSKADVGCIVTIHDITTQKELETMKLDFVSIAAHELRTPLTAIRGYLSLLISENETKNMLTSDQRVYLERSYLSANQLFSLVENLLNVARIERGSVVLDKEPVDWAPLVQQIVQSFMGLANERRVKLSFVPTNTSTKVLVDAIMIGEVLSNLLDNAVRYTKPEGSVLVFLEVTDKFVITHVKDTGQGIPPESVPHLFTKFYRVSGILQQGSKGTGLGLYISKEIVKLHGGDIWVESQIGTGSTFSFSVPRALNI